MAKTWRELKAEGVVRCCAVYKDGRRCRRREDPEHKNGWCRKHQCVQHHIDKMVAQLKDGGFMK